MDVGADAGVGEREAQSLECAHGLPGSQEVQTGCCRLRQMYLTHSACALQDVCREHLPGITF